MSVGKVLMGLGAAVGMLSSTVAMAATTQSAKAPVSGVRSAAPMHKKSSQSEESATGTYIVGGLAAAAVIAGVVVIASDKSNKSSSSPG